MPESATPPAARCRASRSPRRDLSSSIVRAVRASMRRTLRRATDNARFRILFIHSLIQTLGIGARCGQPGARRARPGVETPLSPKPPRVKPCETRDAATPRPTALVTGATRRHRPGVRPRARQSAATTSSSWRATRRASRSVAAELHGHPRSARRGARRRPLRPARRSRRVAERLADAGRPVEVLVNNAGYGLKGSFLRNDVDRRGARRSTCSPGRCWCSRTPRPGDGARGVTGPIINVSSVAGLHRLRHLLRGQGLGHGRSPRACRSSSPGTGVTATALCPGFTRTEFHAAGRHRRRPAPTSSGSTPHGSCARLPRRRRARARSSRSRACSTRRSSALLRVAPRSAASGAGSRRHRPPTVAGAGRRCRARHSGIPIGAVNAVTLTSPAARARLLEIIREQGDRPRYASPCSSGKEADYYVDLRRITLDGEAAPLVGDRHARPDQGPRPTTPSAASPSAPTRSRPSMLHAAAAAGERLDAFVVRKAGKAHGLQQRIEGPSIAGRQVLVVEDTTTTGASPLAAVEAAREDGADRRRGGDHRRPGHRRGRADQRRGRSRVPVRLLARGARARLSLCGARPRRAAITVAGRGGRTARSCDGSWSGPGRG